MGWALSLIAKYDGQEAYIMYVTSRGYMMVLKIYVLVVVVVVLMLVLVVVLGS